MSLTIESFPDRVINNDPLTVSKWSAVHHSILFGMSRKDFQVLFLQDPSNPLRMIVNLQSFSGPITTILTAGDSVYIESPNGSETFVVDEVLNPNKFFVFIGAFTGLSDIFGFCNFLNRENYFVKTHIWKINANNQYEILATSVNKPNFTGRVNVDVSSFLKSLVDYVDEFDYTTLNKKDLTLGGRYNITFSENWIGFEGTFSGLSSTILRYFTNTAKQIQDLYGSNMGEYVPFLNQSAATPKAKFLSDFETPTYFPGFPFSLSFIYSEFLIGTETNKNEEQFNTNNQSVSLTSKLLDNAQAQSVNRMIIDEGYPTTTESIEVWLENSGVADPILYVEETYVEDTYVGGGTEPPIIDQPVSDNPTL